MDVAVYTCILPHTYTTLRPPFVVSENVDYIAFLDAPLDVPPWQNKIIKRNPDMNSRQDMQKYKMLSHQYLSDYTYVVWVDGNCRLKVTPEELIGMLKESGKKVAFGRHPWRYCSYEEGKVCAAFKRNDSEAFNRQMEKYRQEGLPEQYGLIASTFFFRDNRDPETSEFFNLWLEETMLLGKTPRNQISFGYAAFKTKLDYLELEIPWGSNCLYRMGK